MSEQKFIINGINNDKIELVSNYDVRKLNRLIEAEKALINSEWKEKIEQAKKDIAEQRFCEDESWFTEVYLGDVFDILDKLIKGDNNESN